MGLKVVALISGGKDSMFSMLHCASQGHEVVALANLYPPSVSAQEAENGHQSDLNSFMFQTVGHSIVPLYEQALGLPLFRREIAGTAQHKSKDYNPAAVSGDETEDIYTLLSDVKKAYPEVDAVSTGAILSTYQRTRVESVALRLGLTPLGYLWQYPSLPHAHQSPASLLRHMAAVGLDARIIKVASGGLDDSYLWQNLCKERTIRRVQRAVDRFGGSVLGEGGEFETLVLAGPAPIWKARLNIEQSETKVQRADGGEVFLSFKDGALAFDSLPAESVPPTIDIWDSKFSDILASPGVVSSCQDNHTDRSPSTAHAVPMSKLQIGISSWEQLVRFDNLHADLPSSQSITEQAEAVCALLLAQLQFHGLDSSNLIYTTILLRSMSDFAVLNKVYGQLFSQPLPPSRVTIACGDRMPPGVDILISAIAHTNSANRRGLHVQTRSYWAPANIGPYSQARSIPDLSGSFESSVVFVAGQIPLVPARMERQEASTGDALADFASSAALSLQHLWRIGIEQGIGCWTGAVAFLTPSANFKQRALVAREIWAEAHRRPDEADEEDGEVDVWDQRNRGPQNWAQPSEVRSLPDFTRFGSVPELTHDETVTPGFFAVEVAALPRDCAIEWQSSGLVSSETEAFKVWDMHEVNKAGLLPTRAVSGAACETWYYEVSADSLQKDALLDLMRSEQEGWHVTIYATSSFEMDPTTKAQVVPCRRVMGASGEKLVAGAVLQIIYKTQ